MSRNKTEEAWIRELMNTWVKAVRAKDIEGVMSCYVPDILLFDLAPPLEYRGVDAYRKNWEEWFSSFKGAVGYDIRDLRITTGDDAAFCHSLNRISGARTYGEQTEVWVRATVGFRKFDGKWMIAHEHLSVPFEMKEPYKALLDLEP
ncbi:MAG TPA: SgcJ/EcaC family oxidoreductase [Thermodesulfobacteriota bacterium]|nr:SgcJ/EcaC family oxidoreductase [Thermodesulfobacteriota bacterium]